MTRQTFRAILDQIEAEGEPLSFALKALRQVYPQCLGIDAREVASALVLDYKWRSYDQPQFTAFFWDERSNRCGFVWKRVVGTLTDFVAIDNTGKGHRIDGTGLNFVALKPPG